MTKIFMENCKQNSSQPNLGLFPGLKITKVPQSEHFLPKVFSPKMPRQNLFLFVYQTQLFAKLTAGFHQP